MLVALTAAIVLFNQAASPTVQPSPQSAPGAATPTHEVAPVVVTPLAPPNFEAKSKVVTCHDEPKLGSLFPQKVCGTKAQFDERRREDQELVREWTRPPPMRGN